MRNAILRLLLILPIITILTISNIQPAYCQCSGLCLYGKSEDPMTTDPKVADNTSGLPHDRLNSGIPAQRDQELKVHKIKDQPAKPNDGYFMRDAIAGNTSLEQAQTINDSTNYYFAAVDDENGSERSTESDKASPFGTKKDQWEFLAIAYFWALGLTGEAGIGDNVADLDITFLDLAENLSFGLMGHFEAKRNKWGGFFDFIYSKLKPEGNIEGPKGLLNIETKSDVDIFISEAAVVYEVARWPFIRGAPRVSNPPPPLVIFELLGGGRLWHLSQDLNLQNAPPPFPPQISGDKTWFDFMVGGRIKLLLENGLQLTARTDAAGFGLGFSSKFSWNLLTTIGYQFRNGILTGFAYRLIYENYGDGSGDDLFLFKTWIYGPAVFVGYHF